MKDTIRLGISSCLLGEKVRYDGGHKLDRFLADTLGQFVEFVPVCPEVECGFPVPRESFRLVGDPESPRLITVRTRQDHTDRMIQWAQKRVKELEEEDLCGFIFKSDSPSSGMERVRVYSEKGMPVRKGAGIFARVFMEHFPLLPVEEEGRLHDLKLRENFIERIFVFKRWRELLGSQPSGGKLVEFHARHKMLILSHSPDHHRMMGKMVADVKKMPLEELYRKYQVLLMEALRLKTTSKKNVNVLMHALGYFKKSLSADEKQEFLDLLDIYWKGYLPLIVPVTLLNHYVRKYKQPYLSEQYYLHPHPLELQLRNHV
jgi:uncharacterized protein YbgA (DUF1722 family)/uncharacterized protein YbbK (DUF523 family)